MADLRYRLAGPGDAKDAGRWLRKQLGLAAGEPRRERWRMADTFDWRLYRRGLMLLERTDESGPVLVLASLDDETPLRYLEDVGMPRFATDLPAGPFRARIHEITGVRALLPLADLTSSIRRFRQLDGRQKTVLVACIEEHRLAGDSTGEGRLVSRRIRLEPLRGYERHAARASRRLGAQRKLLAIRDNVLAEALAVRKRRPLDYDSKFRIDLDRSMTGRDAACRIFLALLDALEANLQGARAHLDPEFLHDLRVSVRRTRVGLTEFGDVLPRKPVSRFRDGFKWLGRTTGPARDMDVYVERYDSYEASLPADSREALKPFLDFLLANQREAQEILSRQLESKRVKTLLADWRVFLKSTRRKKGRRRGAAPVRDLADARIWRVYRKIVRRGRRIGDDSPAAMLHDLRIRCKKLRYLMEFFRSLYPKKKIAARISALKALQDNLGDFQDFEVQADALRRFARQMTEDGEVPHETILAMGRLAANLDARQERARKDFAARFAAFDAKANDKRFRALFRGRS